MIAPRRKVRRGFTLFECILVVAGLSIILSLCGGLLHAMFRIDRAGRDALRDTQTLARLARQFRQDVHASSAAKPGETTLELTGTDRPTIRYRRADSLLIREEGDGQTVARRESYELARLGRPRFELVAPIVRLVLPRRGGLDPVSAHAEIAVEAALDRIATRAGSKEAAR